MKNNSRKLFTLFLSVIMLVTMLPFSPVSAGAETVLKPGQSAEALEQIENTEDGLFTIEKYRITTRTGEGEQDYSYEYYAKIKKYIGNSGEVTVPEIIDGKYPVTVIGEKAFADRAKAVDDIPALKITKVVLPKTVKLIDREAFSGCPNLTTLVIPQGDVEFYSDSFPVFTTSDGLYTYNRFARREWGDGEYVDTYCIRIVKYLGDETNVTIPEVFDSLTGYLVTDIGDGAFETLEGLEKIVFPACVRSIESRAFESCASLDGFILPEALEVIGSYAFHGCTSLTFLSLPANLKVIGDSAFEGCTSFVGSARIVSETTGEDLVALNLPAGLEEIGAQAFDSCESLIRVIVPEGVKEIKVGTFTNCKALEYVELPYTTETIAVAFNGAYTDHDYRSVYEPQLVIKAPHVLIEESPSMSKSVVFYGGLHSSVNAFVDFLNKREYDELHSHGEIYGQHGDPYVRGFKAIDIPGHVFNGKQTFATCTEGGYTTYLCECGNPTEYVCDFVEALGHDYGEFTTTAEATCVATGSKVRVCQRHLLDENGEPLEEICGEREFVQIPPIGHDYVTVITATCTVNGASFKQCSNCKSKIDVKTVMALGHQIDYKHTKEGEYYFVEKKSVPCPETPAEGETGTSSAGKKKEESSTGLLSLLSLLFGGGGETEPDERASLPEIGKTEIEVDLHNGTTRKLIIGVDDGVEVYKCMFPGCEYVEVAVVSAHPDKDNDHYCDYCDRPVGTSDTSYGTSCTCSCHKQVGFEAVFYKIKLFFWSLFGTNKVCECGAQHY